jgi:ATP-dependent Clp protease ATP-binding subunit ClpA
LELILNQQLAILERHLRDRLQERAFDLELDAAARQFLLEKGTSQEYGARELKRMILRQLTQPLAALVENRKIPPGALVRASYDGSSGKLALEVEKEEAD